MKTRITAVLLATFILFSFAACGNSAEDTSTSANTTIQTTLQETGTTAAETTTETTSASNTDSRTGADTTASTAKATTTAPAAKTFTAAQLAEFNGKDGKNSYVAYNGVVYNVTDSKVWGNGEHKGLLAGTDITDDIKNCKYHIAVDFFQKVWERKNYPQVGTFIG